MVEHCADLSQIARRWIRGRLEPLVWVRLDEMFLNWIRTGTLTMAVAGRTGYTVPSAAGSVCSSFFFSPMSSPTMVMTKQAPSPTVNPGAAW